VLVGGLLVSPMLAAGLITTDPRVSGGTDGAGGLPAAGLPSTAPVIQLDDIATPTLGVLVDAQTRLPICGVMVIVTNSNGEVIAAAFTDDQGKFVVNLFDDPGLELAIPSEGIAGIAIHAGEVLCVFVP
jgi:hypothetical protein